MPVKQFVLLVASAEDAANEYANDDAVAALAALERLRIAYEACREFAFEQATRLAVTAADLDRASPGMACDLRDRYGASRFRPIEERG
jgi:hypothetical protein